jgi:1,4-dihydroxy-2-naphthoate octaprenyltransferase
MATAATSSSSAPAASAAIAPAAPASRVQIWLLAARPRTLTAAVAPVAVGTACAHAAGGIAWGPALAALVGAFALQIGTNFANDVFDAERGADGPDRKGPARAVSSGWISPAAMKIAMALAFAAAAATGVYLTAVAGWPVIAIGVASILAGIAYTGGPYPLGYHGLGDVFVFAFFGVVAVCGTTFVQRGDVPALAIGSSLAVGAVSTAILVVNNLRDRAEDTVTGKRTLAVRFGRRAAVAEYGLLLVAAFAIPAALAAGRGPWLLLPLAVLPLAAVELRAFVRASDGPAFNRCLAGTARLVLIHGLLLAAGVALSA